MFITTKAPDKRSSVLSFDFKYTDVEALSTQPVTMISSSPVEPQSRRFSLNRMFSKKPVSERSSISMPMDLRGIDDCLFKRDEKAVEAELHKEKTKQELLFLIGEGELAERRKTKKRPSSSSSLRSTSRPLTTVSSSTSRLSTHSELSLHSLRPSSTRSSRSSKTSSATNTSYYYMGLPLVKLTSLDSPYRRKYGYGCKTLEEKKLVHQICATRDLEYLPLVLFRCIREINSNLTEVGVYRVNASAQKIEHLRRCFTDHGPLCDLAEYDVHTLTSFLKTFLRQLPDDLFPNPYQEAQPKVLVSVVKTALGKLPKQSIVVLRTICTHIQDVSNHHETNKMSLSTLSRILAPSLRIRSSVLETLVRHTPELWYGMEGSGVYTYEAIEVAHSHHSIPNRHSRHIPSDLRPETPLSPLSPTSTSYPPGLFPSRLYSHENISDESLENQINGVMYCGGAADDVDSDLDDDLDTRPSTVPSTASVSEIEDDSASVPRSSFDEHTDAEERDLHHRVKPRRQFRTSVVSTSTVESQIEPKSPIAETSDDGHVAIHGQAMLLNSAVSSAVLREYKKAPLPAIPQGESQEGLSEVAM
ncbi:Minor histocompatibility protein [Yarrowia sp. C11]|nr:Minor histocompatibility protein [Yarrowia sp. E02]KAG5369727.1 Minor histocompatibility protein [Yarrowia sp. C11]